MTNKEPDLQHVMFLRTLADDFNYHRRQFEDWWHVFFDYANTPKEMAEDEAVKVVDALSKCYQSVKFLQKIARLVETEIIHPDLLYILYYKEISSYLTKKFEFLITWCGTGLDLGADYDSYEIARIADSVLNLLDRLNIIHEQHGVNLEEEGYNAVLWHFKEHTKEFFADPGKFSVLSDNYIDNYVVTVSNSE